MKTTKLVIGIFSMVFFIFILLQSCAAGLLNAMNGDTSDSSGAAGVFLAIFMLIGGIVGASTRRESKGGYYAGAFYLIAALIGFSSLGTFSDLVIWSIISSIFSIIFIGSGIMKKKSNTVSVDTSNNGSHSKELPQNVQKIIGLKKLYDEGIISELEYNKRKSDLLDEE